MVLIYFLIKIIDSNSNINYYNYAYRIFLIITYYDNIILILLPSLN